MAQTRGFGSIATLMHDGTVLIAGGDDYRAREQIYDPGAGIWTQTRSMADWRYDFSATLLSDGRVLAAGGRTAAGVEERWATAELYDPATGRWTATGNMTAERGGHTATLLPGGRVLVTGGHVYSSDPGGRRPLASSELYDPATGRWTATGNLVTARGGHVATLLPSGKVLIAGGASEAARTLASAELYDPANGRWTATGTMIDERYGPSIVGLPDGTALVIGGQDSDITAKTAERYDPDSGRWTATGSLDEGRHGFTATLLADGRVLVAGGRSADRFGIALASAELYDPRRGRWTHGPSMEAGRIYATATVLDDGTVLVAGGAGGGWLTSAERYDQN